MLNLCLKPECPHPLCADKSVRRDAVWYKNGPVLSYIPVSIPDPKRPWGGKCQECTTFCSGHYMSPQQHEEFVKKHGAAGVMYKPPSVVIKEQLYEHVRTGRSISESKLEDVARKTLLSIEELQMHVEHLRLTAEWRKEGAKKAALTRKKKSTTTTTGRARKRRKQRVIISLLTNIKCNLWLHCIIINYYFAGTNQRSGEGVSAQWVMGFEFVIRGR